MKSQIVFALGVEPGPDGTFQVVLKATGFLTRQYAGEMKAELAQAIEAYAARRPGVLDVYRGHADVETLDGAIAIARARHRFDQQ